jgi:hypothetical protein
VCGIAGWYCWGKDRPDPALIKALLLVNQSRGRDASGVAYLDPDDDEITVQKAPGPAEKLVKDLGDTWNRIASSPRGLLHTRAQTKGSPSHNENNHPVVGCGWVVVHNGMVQNDDSLFEYYKTERFAEVDTAAIPLVLSKGKTGKGTSIEDSMEGLTILGGSATFAAWSPKDQETIILGRLGFNDLYLFADSKAKTLYWSSAPSAERIMPSLQLGGLRFATVSKLSDDRLVTLNPDWAKCETYKVDRKPFFLRRTWSGGASTGGGKGPHGEWTPYTGNTVGDANGKGSVKALPVARGPAIEFADYSKNIKFLWNQRVVEIGQLGKPKPEFNGIPTDYNWLGEVEDKLTRDKKKGMLVPTCYGTWHFDVKETIEGKEEIFRHFKGHKRVKRFYHRLFNEKLLLWDELPAIVENGTTALDFVLPREDLTFEGTSVHGTFSKFGQMCPWCGVILPQMTWIQENDRCKWCRVRSVAGHSFSTARLARLMEETDDKSDDKGAIHDGP